MMAKILVPGVSGLLGLNLAMAKHNQHEIVGVTHSHGLKQAPFAVRGKDLSLADEAKRLVDEIEPDWIINCAAIANVDLCEKEQELARRMNADLPGALAQSAASRGIPFVHISTDAVFDGQTGLYSETSQPNPINHYARTKLAGEHAVMNANPDALIARVNFYGWSISGKRSLSEFFFNHLSRGEQVNGFTDVFYCPMMVNDLVDTLFEMVENDLRGLYHVVGEQVLSKYDFAVELAEEFGFDAGLVQPISWRDASLTAVRSPNLTLNVAKLIGDLGHRLPDLAHGLKQYHQQAIKRYPELLQSFSIQSA